MNEPNSGPAMITAGIATINPKINTRPRSACRLAIATSGPGCGGTNPCSTESPASAGIPTRSTGWLARRGPSSTIGGRRATPISKKNGGAVRAAAPPPPHRSPPGPPPAASGGAPRGAPPHRPRQRPRADPVDDAGHDPVGTAGRREQPADHRPQRDEQADAARRRAQPGGEAGDDVGGRDPGDRAEDGGAEDQRE